MVYITLTNLQLVLFFICLVIKNFKKIFINQLIINNIIVYCTIIISNIPNKIIDYIELKIVKCWLT